MFGDWHHPARMIDSGDEDEGEEPPGVVSVFDNGAWKISTPVRPAHANHSYNGVMFDVQSISIEDVWITAINIGGEIGPYTVYWREGSIALGFKHAADWTQCASGHVDSSEWQGIDLPLQEPVFLKSHRKIALYIHSSLDNDQAIAYQTYPSMQHPICSDGKIALFPGQGRVGNEPFDNGAAEQRWGWFRAPRGLAGGLTYRCLRRQWTPEDMLIFPESFQNVIMQLHLIYMFSGEQGLLGILPLECFYMILGQLDWSDFEPVPMEDIHSD